MQPSQNFPPNVLALVQQQLSFLGEIGATKVLTVPRLSAAIAAGVGNVSPPQTVYIREPGTIIALQCSELRGTAAGYAEVGIGVQIGGTTNLFTDGQVGTFVPLLELVGGANRSFGLLRRAEPNVNWVVQYTNFSAVNAANPSASFLFIADADLARFSPAK